MDDSGQCGRSFTVRYPGNSSNNIITISAPKFNFLNAAINNTKYIGGRRIELSIE